MGAFWDRHALTINPEKFRGQDQYLGEQSIERFALMLEYIRTLPVPYLETLKEEGDFGVVCADVDGIKMSRDLHDSVVELDFLGRMCGLPLGTMTVLDIGAGYGRLAHRMTTLWPTSRVFCTDAIAVSQRLCRRYLAHCNSPAAVLTPNMTDATPAGFFDLAMNVHSWPECTRAEINGWLDWLVAHHVPRLFVVPHTNAMLCNADQQSFKPDIEARGFRVAKHWRGPDRWVRDFFLFERMEPR